jgi:electron transfer flavoprotein alpha subunit
MNSGKSILIFIEKTDEDIEENSLEVLSKGSQMAAECGEGANAVMIGSRDSESMKMLAAHGADKIYVIDHPELRETGVESCAEALYQLLEEKKPEIILFGASFWGNDIACRIAPRLEAALVTNCSDISLDENQSPLFTKSTFGGKVSSTFLCPTPVPQMATVIPGVFEKKKPDYTREAQSVVFHPQLAQDRTRIKRVGLMKADPEKIGLDEAEILVSGGRGMVCKENFELVKGLSKTLGGAVGASLGAVDDGFAPRKHLVGQTGTTVTPKLYMACGISGSIYHVLGMKDSKAIVAINKDRNADIFKYSDMGIVGDAAEIIGAINTKLRSLLKDRNDRQQNS